MKEDRKPVEEEFVGVADLSCDLAMHVLCKAAMLSYSMLCTAISVLYRVHLLYTRSGLHTIDVLQLAMHVLRPRSSKLISL